MGKYTGQVPVETIDQAGEPDSPRDVAGPVSAVLRISLGPAFPGNVHVYDITIDPCDGTFTGAASRVSNIRSETINGALSAGNTDIDFTAVYPIPAYDYAWFGTGPLGGFTGGDSLGNVMNTLSGTVTYPADDRDDTPEIVVTEVAPAVEVAIVADDMHDVVLTEPEPAIEDEPVVTTVDVEQTVDSPPDEVPVHAAGCQCLGCRWAAFKPIPVTEGPFAGKAFYFGASGPVPDDETHVESSVSEHADTSTTKAAHSSTRGKRRLVA